MMARDPWSLLSPAKRRRAMALSSVEVGSRREDRVCVSVNRSTGEIGSVSRAESLAGLHAPTVRESVEAWIKRR